MNALVALAFVASSSIGGGGALIDYALNRGLGHSVGPPPGGNATPVFDTGDPESVAWGPTAHGTTLVTPNGSFEPLFLYLGQDADLAGAGNWPASVGDMTLDSSTVNKTEGLSTPFHDATEAVSNDVSNAGGISSTSGTPFAWGGTEDDDDWLLLFAMRNAYAGSGADRCFGFSNSGDTDGWELRPGAGAANSFTCFSVGDANARPAAGGSDATAVNTWVVGACTALNDGATATTHAYHSGIRDANDTSAPAEVTVSDVSMFTNSTGTSDCFAGFRMAAVGLWQGDLWSSAADMDTAVSDISHSWMAGLPDTPSSAPSTATRASTAYVRKCDPTANATTYYEVDDDWPRREVSCGYTWDDPTSSETTVGSFLQEAAVANEICGGDDLSDACWTHTNITSLTRATDTTSPLGYSNALVADATDSTHTARNTITWAGSGTNDVISVFAKAGDRNWATLHKTGGLCGNEFDLANCAAGASSEGSEYVTSGAEDWGNGWCRIYLVCDDPTAGGAWFFFGGAHADGDRTWAGDASTVSVYFAGAMQEESTLERPSSYVATVDATDVTRSADSGITYALTGPTTGTIVVDHMATSPAGRSFNLSDGTTAERVDLTSLSSDNRISSLVRGTGGSAAAGDVSSGVGTYLQDTRYIARLTWAPDDMELYLDGTSIGTDTSVGDPTGMDEASIGSATFAAAPANKSIYRARAFDSAIAPGEQGTGDDTP